MSAVSEEDHWRAQAWHLLAHLLAQPPEAALLHRLGALPDEGGDQPLNLAWSALGRAARSSTPEQVEEEYMTLFIGPPRGELVPYASWYLTGFLMEKPLALLRQELTRLGYARQAGVKEPEDHVAALCETHCLLIDAGDSRQASFFAQHMAPWLGRFFADLEACPAAEFYRAVGALGVALFAVERFCLESS